MQIELGRGHVDLGLPHRGALPREAGLSAGQTGLSGLKVGLPSGLSSDELAGVDASQDLAFFHR